jgi:hypothetical protein
MAMNIMNAVITIGDIIQTMHFGHIVDAEVVDIYSNSQFQCKFLKHHESGSEKLCLDMGNDLYIYAGGLFTTYSINIKRAKDLLAAPKGMSVDEAVTVFANNISSRGNG